MPIRLEWLDIIGRLLCTLAAGTTPWMVQIHGNDVNWDYHPRTDDFSQKFADLDDALRYTNGEDDSYFAESTVPARRSYWPWERPPESYVVIDLVRAGHRRAANNREPLESGDDRSAVLPLI